MNQPPIIHVPTEIKDKKIGILLVVIGMSGMVCNCQIR